MSEDPDRLRALSALLEMSDEDDLWRDHRITQEGLEGRMETIWPQYVKAYISTTLHERKR